MYFIASRRALWWLMFVSYIHWEISCTTLDSLVRECFTRYISDPMPLLYISCKSYDIFVSVSWLRKIPLCGVAGVLKVISDSMSLLKHWVVLLIISGWEILRVVLVRSCFIVHPKKSSNSPIDRVAYSFLVHLIEFINDGLSSIESLPSMYTMMI